jgi:hypothetical protein
MALFKRKAPQNFGAMVIGEEAAKANQQAVQERRTKFGPLVLGTKVMSGTNTPAPGSEDVEKTETMIQSGLSVNGIREKLEQNKHLLKNLASMELKRPDGPRRQALTVLLEAAEAQENEKIAEAMRDALEDLTPKKPAASKVKAPKVDVGPEDVPEDLRDEADYRNPVTAHVEEHDEADLEEDDEEEGDERPVTPPPPPPPVSVPTTTPGPKPKSKEKPAGKK